MTARFRSYGSDGNPVIDKSVAGTGGSGDAGKVVHLNSSGKFPDDVLPDRGLLTATASEALTAGSYVALHTVSGATRCRLADNSNLREAIGFVKAAVASGSSASIYPRTGMNDSLSSLTVGSHYWMGTSGSETDTALDLTDSGNINSGHQYLGVAIATDTIDGTNSTRMEKIL